MDKTVFEKQIEWLIDENVQGEEIIDFEPFMVSEQSLPLKIREEFSKGKKCVWSKKKQIFFRHTLLLTFKGKNGYYYNLYVGFLDFTFCVIANIDEFHSKVMNKYGHWHDGELYLDRGSSQYKVPLFTKIFEERQNVGKPYFLPHRGYNLIGLQLSGEELEDDKSFYNVVGGMLTLCQSLIKEIEGAQLDKYSFAEDLKAALKMYLLLN